MDMPWRTCGVGQCQGAHVSDDRCLAHLEQEQRREYFAGLRPGADVDLRRTEMNPDLVKQLVRAVRNDDGHAVFGRVDFAEARFREFANFEKAGFASADFTRAEFAGPVKFEKAVLRGRTSFADAQFGGNVSFAGSTVEELDCRRAVFSGNVKFDQAIFVENGFARLAFRNTRFGKAVWFDHVVFRGDIRFQETQFRGETFFRRAVFEKSARFSPAGGFSHNVWFDDAEFLGLAGFEGLEFRGYTSFADAKFGEDVIFGGSEFHDVARFDKVRFGGRARFQEVRFDGDTCFDGAEFETAELFGPVEASQLSFRHANFRKRVVVDTRTARVDCAEAVFEEGVTLQIESASVDLERAVFGKPSTVAGTTAEVTSLRGTDVEDLVLTDVDLSKCLFAGAHHLDKLRIEGDCTFGSPRRRQTLAEERAWRTKSMDAIRPRRVAGLYRQLRKAQEDSKNEPGAADFYYGEMEMRRHSPATPWSERAILHLYWLISGYGLRALRALATLAVLIALATVGFRLGGFKTTPAFGDTLIYVAQSTVSLETKLASLPKDLTPFGEVMRLVMRVLGPLLLGLTLLAVRNRVKR
ncbi:pentapeptide repeat-containing protein [Amycolatopsis decaplanina]|uniref:Pentapeptide repeat-containing protein n=1 Tax=Amycolatopsis decaplanina DSM 44594 TaxID=1284240 RepID=M2Z521_9PSEU|nr:pentapeptide repeat-containing protein [Amycolatopsis decaplanina]EME55724.1 hypothetical protein H074_25370 [Amycolatopsis decaplanina DSM 44594]